MKKVLGIGNALVDILIQVKNDTILNEMGLPKGSMQLIDEIKAKEFEKKIAGINTDRASGGSAANTIHGLAKLGIGTGYLGKINNDKLGDFFKKDMITAGVESYLFNGNNSTGRALTFITPDAERTFATYLGAAVEVSPDDLNKINFKDFGYLHLEGYLILNHDLVESAIQKAKEYGLKISLDLASYNVVESNLGFLKRIIKESIDILFANEEEAKAYTGKDPYESLEIIAQECEIAVVKLGEKGSIIKSKKGAIKVDAIKAKAIDTTGAGDLYASGFIYGMAKNLDLEKCAKIAALVAGKITEVVGAKLPGNYWKEIKAKIKEIEVT